MAALAISILVNRLRMPGPVLGNEDIIFWFVSQRMFPPIITAFALFLMYSEMGRAGLKLIETHHMGWGPPDWRLDGQIRRYKLVDDLFSIVGRLLLPRQASSLYLLATKSAHG